VATLIPALADAAAGTGAPSGDRDALERTAAEWLWQRWEETPGWQQFLDTVRAAQVAAFTAGFFVQVDLDQLVGTATTLPRRALRDERTWALLQAYAQPNAAPRARSPRRASVWRRCGSSPSAATTPRPASRSTRPASGTPSSPRPGSTSRRSRRCVGSVARPTTTCCWCTRHGHPLSANTVAATIRTVRREVGAAVALARPDRANRDPKRWYRRLGLSIKELGR